MTTIRREFLLRGVVQGVGFRPHVATTATRHPVTGFCGNDDVQVFIEAQGTAAAVAAFIKDVLDHLPPLAHVISSSSRELPTKPAERNFTIVGSRTATGARTLIPPDVGTCPDCLADIRDSNNRRYRYPFTTCTNCGPRLSIIEDLPYDRPATTMRAFAMCPSCLQEYTDPTDRRYHAQPISCYDCGPQLWIVDANAPTATPVLRQETRSAITAALAEARRRLRAGEILAVKGLGGFHLMCDARNEEAVSKLRNRKRRSGKPFAVMVANQDAARRLAVLSPSHENLLASPARPIVIAPMTDSYNLAFDVAPGLHDVGLLLPYTPLHTLLVEDGGALVATSGNQSDEPLCYTNEEAVTRLSHLADAFLLHDRDIHVPVEDSVYLENLPTRRSRGYAPLPIPLPDGPTALAVGGEIKNSFALATGDLAFVSTHIGDMGSLAAQQAFQAAVEQMLRIHRDKPDIVVSDLHPNYSTTGWAERYCETNELPLLRIQHHYAHALSLLTEHGIFHGPAVVAALDGTGYGPDGTIWGGEILTLGTQLSKWERTWHVPHFGLVGGDRAIKHPWRVALGIAHAWGITAASLGPSAEEALVNSQLTSGFGVVQTSSLGRVFDAASALLGICTESTYEAQAAMELESAARQSGNQQRDNLPATFPELFAELQHPTIPVPHRAWRFHIGLATIIAAELANAAHQAQTDLVGITGGCALNRLFVQALSNNLNDHGFTVLTHRTVPPNDGGLSLGQAAAARLMPN